MLDAESEVDGLEAGRVAAVVERAFLGAMKGDDERQKYILRCALSYMLSNLDDINECFEGDVPITEEEVNKLAAK